MMEQELFVQWVKQAPTVQVYLQRLVKKGETGPVECQVTYFNRRMYIVDLFKNKCYSMRQYGKKWAFRLEDLKENSDEKDDLGV